jgi:DNA repair protein RecO (recombination protein O)
MFSKTEIIVLNYTKYSESSIILHALTKKHGKQSIIIYGIGGSKRTKLGLFQPLSILETQLYYKPNASLQKVKEFKLLTPLFSIPGEIGKSSLALFISELLYRTIHEEYADEKLFDFIKTSVLILEELSFGLPVFHIAFMVKLAKQMGIMSEEKIELPYYDLKESSATDIKPSHKYFITKDDYNLLIDFLGKPYTDIHLVPISVSKRNYLLESVVRLFELHFLNFNSLRSFEVLKEALNG